MGHKIEDCIRLVEKRIRGMADEKEKKIVIHDGTLFGFVFKGIICF